MKRIFKGKIIYIIIIFIGIVSLLFTYYYSRSITMQYYFKGTKKEILPENIFYLEKLGLGDFTCTGLTFSINSNTFWIADFGANSQNEKKSPRLIEVNNSFDTVEHIIELKDFTEDINLQGIDYDDSNDTIWIATGNSIYNINKNGTIIKQINQDDFKGLKTNGIFCDEEKQEIYVLLNSKYLLQYGADGSLNNKERLNYFNQDHFIIYNGAFFLTIGADYNGNNNFILKIENGRKSIFKMIDSYAIEGLTIVGNKIYVINDGWYHNAKIKKSYVIVYSLDNVL